MAIGATTSRLEAAHRAVDATSRDNRAAEDRVRAGCRAARRRPLGLRGPLGLARRTWGAPLAAAGRPPFAGASAGGSAGVASGSGATDSQTGCCTTSCGGGAAATSWARAGDRHGLGLRLQVRARAVRAQVRQAQARARAAQVQRERFRFERERFPVRARAVPRFEREQLGSSTSRWFGFGLRLGGDRFGSTTGTSASVGPSVAISRAARRAPKCESRRTRRWTAHPPPGRAPAAVRCLEVPALTVPFTGPASACAATSTVGTARTPHVFSGQERRAAQALAFGLVPAIARTGMAAAHAEVERLVERVELARRSTSRSVSFRAAAIASSIDVSSDRTKLREACRQGLETRRAWPRGALIRRCSGCHTVRRGLGQDLRHRIPDGSRKHARTDVGAKQGESTPWVLLAVLRPWRRSRTRARMVRHRPRGRLTGTL